MVSDLVGIFPSEHGAFSAQGAYWQHDSLGTGSETHACIHTYIHTYGSMRSWHTLKHTLTLTRTFMNVCVCVLMSTPGHPELCTWEMREVRHKVANLRKICASKRPYSRQCAAMEDSQIAELMFQLWPQRSSQSCLGEHSRKGIPPSPCILCGSFCPLRLGTQPGFLPSSSPLLSSFPWWAHSFSLPGAISSSLWISSLLSSGFDFQLLARPLHLCTLKVFKLSFI